MVIYLRTYGGQPDSLAKVKSIPQLAGVTGLEREKVVTAELGVEDISLELLLGYSKKEEESMRSGVHLYWNNVLIIPFFHAFGEIKADGIIGVANVSCLGHTQQSISQQRGPLATHPTSRPHHESPCASWAGRLFAGKCREGGFCDKPPSALHSESAHR